MTSPNVWSLGDRPLVKDGAHWVSVEIVAFQANLVRVTMPDGTQRLRTHDSMRRA